MRSITHIVFRARSGEIGIVSWGRELVGRFRAIVVQASFREVVLVAGRGFNSASTGTTPRATSVAAATRPPVCYLSFKPSSSDQR